VPAGLAGDAATPGGAPAASRALAFDGVSKRYRSGALALDGVTWSIPLGARACLLGPNGAGKSTAIRLLEGAIAPTSGRVRLLGADVGDRAAYGAARRRTGVVPQGPGMYADVTVGEYLDLARRIYGRGEVGRMLDRFDLGRYRDRMLAQLSGGYQRRLALAAALLSEPDVLLLDEPTVGLDPVAAHDVHAFLREAMAGRSALLCTHNLAEAEALCDEVVILRDGKVLVQAPLDDLRRRASPRLRLAARQGQAPMLAALRGRGRAAEPAPGDAEAVLVAVADARAEAPALLRGLLADGLDVYACAPVEPSLEDLFLDFVRGGPRP
jgi:ABC-2 type transport system ATP-binding protein